MSILNHDQALRSIRGTIVSRVGAPPLTEFARGENVTRYHLQFTDGRVILERRDGQAGWATVEDTTKSAPSPQEIPSGPSSSTAMPAGRYLAEALEAVHGSTAEETLRRRVASLSRHRGGVLHEARRIQFNNGTCVTFIRQPGSASWTQGAE